MSKNYDNYGYENGYKTSGVGLIRKILIVLMILIAIFLIIYLLKGCKRRGNNNNVVPKTDYNYETTLLSAGKTYYGIHQDELPTSQGECSIVELDTLLKASLIDSDKFGSCNVNTTYVKVCKLENGTLHYTPWLTCVKDNSDIEYGALREGYQTDIIADQTYLEFKFMPQEATKEGQILGAEEEMWKDEIKYDSYKTLKSTKYYRYRDKLFIWELINRNYYTSTGTKNKASEVTEYYKSSPNVNYTLSSDKATAYKYYKSSSTREYYKVDGVKTPSPVPVGDYTIKDPNGYDSTRYRTRTVIGTYSPSLYFGCSASSSSTIIKYTKERCGTGDNAQYPVTREAFYTCATDADLVKTSPHVNANATCKKYSDWSSLTTTKCDTSKPDVCESYTITFYYWYKIIDEVRTYYPSGSTKASNEKVYFTSEPFKGAIRDTSTKTTAYKWYNESTRYSSSYSAVAPSGYTKTNKTDDYKWGEWSDWSTKNPKVSDGRERSIETKTKIKLQEIKGTTSSSWNNLTTDYVSEEELIKAFNDKGYKVKTLEDVLNNGQIRYQLKLFVRNKKESK